MTVEVPWARRGGVLVAQVTRSGESAAETARRQLEFGKSILQEVLGKSSKVAHALERLAPDCSLFEMITGIRERSSRARIWMRGPIG